MYQTLCEVNVYTQLTLLYHVDSITVLIKSDPKAYLDECTAEARALGLKGPQFVAKSVIPRIIRSGRTALCLQSFYTAGPKEVRAWTIQKGTTAPSAAGVIHTDFERGFIKAEVIAIADYKQFKTEAGCRENGKIKQIIASAKNRILA